MLRNLCYKAVLIVLARFGHCVRNTAADDSFADLSNDAVGVREADVVTFFPLPLALHHVGKRIVGL